MGQEEERKRVNVRLWFSFVHCSLCFLPFTFPLACGRPRGPSPEAPPCEAPALLLSLPPPFMSSQTHIHQIHYSHCIPAPLLLLCPCPHPRGAWPLPIPSLAQMRLLGDPIRSTCFLLRVPPPHPTHTPKQPTHPPTHTHLPNSPKQVMDEARKKRAAALEEKRKRLEEMKKKRAEREGAGGGGGGGEGGGGVERARVTRSTRGKEEKVEKEEEDGEQLDALIDSLLSAPPPTQEEGMASSGKEEQAAAEEGGGGGKAGSGAAAVTLSIAQGLGTYICVFLSTYPPTHLPTQCRDHHHSSFLLCGVL